MRKGTHNSLTYSKLKNWWIYPFNWIAKCQSKTIQEQYEIYNVKDFDIRIRFNKNGLPYACHGIAHYKVNLEEVFKYLNSKGDCTVRLILEKTKAKNDNQESCFISYVMYLQNKYSSIVFWQFTRKYDWKQLYESPYREEFYDQDISSVKGKGIWPWFYAKKHNKQATTNKELLLLDFIQYGY